MNARTSRLLHRISSLDNVRARTLKRRWNQLPPDKRAAYRTELHSLLSDLTPMPLAQTPLSPSTSAK